MHLLTIVYGPTGTTWGFLFKNPQLADSTFSGLEAAKQKNEGIVSVFDEFSNKAVLEVAKIHGFQLEDMAQSQLAAIERQMHHERFVAKVRQTAGADPAIRAAHSQQSPAVLTPMGNGRFS